jgi:transitional endoplasmic reticulum ATPase
LDNLNKKVDDLPDYIIIEEGNGWEIEYRDDFFGTTVQKRSIGVKYVPKVEQPEIPFGTGFFSKGLFEKGKDEKKENDDRKRFIPETTYDDIGGIDEIIDQVREVIELPLKRPDLYQHLGIKPHKGILLFGEPGNGKTLIAKAIANEVKAHFIPVSGSELISKYIGESEENLREIFKEARELKPSIIFFDEIDSVAQRRSDDEMNRHEAKFVNQLLTLMDGMEEYDNVTILASTNRPELLDEALLRPGRFDFKIEIQRPNEKGCLKILKIKTQKMPLDVSLDLNQIVPMLVGCSGSEITFIVKEAGMNALKRAVNIKDLISKDIWVDLDLNKIHVIFDDFKKAIAELKDNTL